MILLRIFWRATPAWIKWAALGAAVLALAFLAGGQWEKRGAALRAAENRVEHIKDAQEVQNEIENLPDDQFRNDLERWLLPKAD